MLTKLILRNFKRFKNAEIELGKSVVFDIDSEIREKLDAIEGVAKNARTR